MYKEMDNNDVPLGDLACRNLLLMEQYRSLPSLCSKYKSFERSLEVGYVKFKLKILIQADMITSTALRLDAIYSSCPKERYINLT